MNDSLFDIAELAVSSLGASEEEIAIGVSGGPDSMALCHVLSRISKRTVHALTVDHALRPEAGNEARQVGLWLSGWHNVRHEILKRVLPENANTKIQEEARHDRYALMAEYCAAHGIKYLFAAHHQDDQAETFLFRLAKGSGLDGLGAMRPVYPYSEGLQIVRPFLDVPKSALVSYCNEHHIPFIADPSNENLQYARARLRRSYKVLAEEGLTPKRLAATAQRLARAREALDFYTAEVFDRALLEVKSIRIVLDMRALENEPAEIQMRVLVKAMGSLKNKQDYGPRMEKLEDLAYALFSSRKFRRRTLGGFIFSRQDERNVIRIEVERRGTAEDAGPHD